MCNKSFNGFLSLTDFTHMCSVCLQTTQPVHRLTTSSGRNDIKIVEVGLNLMANSSHATSNTPDGLLDEIIIGYYQ